MKKQKSKGSRNGFLEAVAVAVASTGSACVVIRTKKSSRRKLRRATAGAGTADHWTRDPEFVTEIEKAKRSLSRMLTYTLGHEGIKADIRFDTGFRVRSLPKTSEAALVIEFPGHFHCDTDEADADDEVGFVDGFAVQYAIAPRSASALWRPGTGLRERGKYGGVVTVTTSVGSSRRPVQFIHQSRTLGSVLGKSDAVVALVTDALHDTYEASVHDAEDSE